MHLTQLFLKSTHLLSPKSKLYTFRPNCALPHDYVHNKSISGLFSIYRFLKDNHDFISIAPQNYNIKTQAYNADLVIPHTTITQRYVPWLRCSCYLLYATQ